MKKEGPRQHTGRIEWNGKKEREGERDMRKELAGTRTRANDRSRFSMCDDGVYIYKRSHDHARNFRPKSLTSKLLHDLVRISLKDFESEMKSSCLSLFFGWEGEEQII